MQPMLSTLEAVYRGTVQARLQALPEYNPVLPASLERSGLEIRKSPRPCA